MRETFEYDVFISHSSKDKPAVRELAKRLRDDGLRVWLDEWEIKPGDPISIKVERGLEQSRALILVMSANAFASEWVTLERHTVMFRDPTNAQRRFIPLRLDDAEIRDTLKQFAYVDWREKSDQEYAKLLKVCRRSVVEDSEVAEEEETTSRRVLGRHTRLVSCVTVTPDGRFAISGSDDNTLKVWDLETETEVRTLKGHKERIWCVTVTPDSQFAISGSNDNTLKVWDPETGAEVRTLRGHTEAVLSVTLISDGRFAISGSVDETLKVWDLETGAVVRTLKGHIGYVWCVTVTPDGQFAISGSSDTTLKVWDLKSGDCTGTLEGHTSAVNGVALTPDGRLAVSGADDGTVRVWDLSFLLENQGKTSA